MDSSSQNTKPVLVSRKPQTKFLQETKLFTVLIPPAPARTPLGGTDSWDVAVPPPNGTTRNSHISQARPALRTPVWVQVHYTQVRGAEAWGASALSFSIHVPELQGREMERADREKGDTVGHRGAKLLFPCTFSLAQARR